MGREPKSVCVDNWSFEVAHHDHQTRFYRQSRPRSRSFYASFQTDQNQHFYRNKHFASPSEVKPFVPIAKKSRILARFDSVYGSGTVCSGRVFDFSQEVRWSGCRSRCLKTNWISVAIERRSYRKTTRVKTTLRQPSAVMDRTDVYPFCSIESLVIKTRLMNARGETKNNCC